MLILGTTYDCIPLGQLTEDANICMHDLVNLGCQFPKWHYSTQPTKQRLVSRLREDEMI